MRVVQVTTLHPWSDNRIFRKIVTSLAQKGYEVHYLAPDPGIDKKTVKYDGVTFHWLNNRTGGIGKIIRMLIALKIIYRLRPAIVHFHDPEFLLAAIVLKFTGIKVVYDIHEDNLLALQQKEYFRKYPRIVSFLIAHCFAFFERLVSLMMTVVIAEKCYKKRFPSAVPILNYPKTDVGFPVSLDSETEKIRLIYTGNISRDRGAFQMLNICRLIENSELHMVGRCDNKLKKELEDYSSAYKNKIHWNISERGIPFSEIKKSYIQFPWTAGLAVFPKTEHYFEKELTKFFEYMSYGLPVICSNFPVWQQLIEGNEVGFTCEPDDFGEVVDKIRRLAENKNLRDKIRIQGQLLVSSKYNWATQEEKLFLLYESLH